MKKNLYYRSSFRRQGLFREMFFDFFLTIASFPRMLIEVFTRKNFGERYFSYFTALVITTIMMFYPVIVNSISSFFTRTFDPSAEAGPGLPPWSNDGGILGNHTNQFSPRSNSPYTSNPYGQTGNPGLESRRSNTQYLTWYLFLLGFIWASYLRHQEVKRNPSVFDFARFSLYTGDIHPFFYNLKIAKGNPRAIETFYEPLGFFILGVILWLIGQSLGWVLVLASVCYALSYAAAYRKGDDFVMDKIDEMIANEQMEAAFIHDEPSDKTKGFQFYGKKPSLDTLRRKLADKMIVDDDEDDAAMAV